MGAAHPFRRFGRPVFLGIAVALLVGVAAVVAVGVSSAPRALDDPSLWGAGQMVTHPRVFGPSERGGAVDGEGDTALVGWPSVRGDLSHASVYRRSGSVWSAEATFAPSDGVVNDRFGIDVAISGDTAIVGAPFRGNPARQGAAYIFTRSGTDWTEKQILPGYGDDWAGAGVDIEGDLALVGAPEAEDRWGVVRIYRRTGALWSQVATLTSPVYSQGTFGMCVVLRGNDAFVGAPGVAGSVGSVYAYSRVGDTWSPSGSIPGPVGVPAKWFGRDMAVSGERLLVGAGFDVGHPGAAYVFERSGPTWSQVATLVPQAGLETGTFGYSVALNGSDAFVGTPFVADGAVCVFRGPSWSQIATLTPPPRDIRMFGSSVKQWGDVALVAEAGRAGSLRAAHFLHTPVYSTPQGVTLQIPAGDGVLANDRHSDSEDHISAARPSVPAHGTVALAQDGGFVYTPDPSFSGVDTFTYQAYDGFSYSSTATVSITVVPPPPMQVPVSPYSVRRRRVFQVYGMTPHRHRPGTYPVVLDCYRLEDGVWVWRKAVSMKAYRHPNGRKYGRWLRLPSKGHWRLIARDTEGGVTMYSTPRYMRVR
jgi:hypothetical protein